MSGHGVPHNYRGASAVDAFVNSMLADARAKWIALSQAQQLALSGTRTVLGGRVLSADVPKQTADALVAAGLVEPSSLRHYRLTGIGEAVREAGIYTRSEP